MPSAVYSFVVLVTLICANASVSAHSTDETYIWLNPVGDRYRGEVEMRVPDLREYLKLDVPEEAEAAKKYLEENSAELEGYLREHFHLSLEDGEEVDYEITGIGILELNKLKNFVRIFYETPAFEDLPDTLVVESTLLFEFDRFSRSVVCMNESSFSDLPEFAPKSGSQDDNIELAEGIYHTIFHAGNTKKAIDFRNVEQISNSRGYYIWEGVRHIWIGTDHILFLVTLLLTSVLTLPVKKAADGDESQSDEKTQVESTQANSANLSAWSPVSGFRAALWNILKIVTVFTIAHSITLALASLEIISLESWLVESIIAFSIIIVAANNIFPIWHDKTWVVLFAFGLFHGMGFASVMRDLPFRMVDLTNLLLSFNIGVELGQLAIVACVFPVIFALRKMSFYKPLILVGGSIAICLVALNWFIERAFLGA